MQIIARATVLAAALLVSAPLLAAESETSMAGTDAPTRVSSETTEQDDLWLSPLPVMNSPADLGGLLPKPGSTPPDTAEIDRRLARWDDHPEGSAAAYGATAMPSGTGAAWPWSAEASRAVGGLSLVPAKAAKR